MAVFDDMADEMVNFKVPDFTVVVPARYGSTRLPGKPLLEIAGEPMVAHVWRRACQSHASRVVVATDDSRIRDAMLPYGAEVIMTRDDDTFVELHNRAKDVAKNEADFF